MMSNSIETVPATTNVSKSTIWSRRPNLPRGGLAGDTQIIHASSGWPLTLRELVTRQEGLVHSMGEASVIGPEAPEDFVAHQPARMYRLTTYTGRSIQATAEQRFLTRSGWRRLGSLGAADAVAVVSDYPGLFGTGDVNPNLLKLLVYLTAADASANGGTALVEDRDVRAELMSAVAITGDEAVPIAENGAGVRFAVRGHGGARSRALAFLEMVGAHGVAPEDRFVPDFVFGLRRDLMKLYIGRVFTADAVIESSGRLHYRTQSVRMARQMQHLLSRFGITSLLRDIDLRGELVAVDLEISSKSDVLRFVDEIGFFGAKAERAEAVRSALTPMRMSEPFDRLGPILFDRVWDLEEMMPAPVFDIAFPRADNFIANDFVVRAGDSVGVSVAGWPADEVTANGDDGDDGDDGDVADGVPVAATEGHA